ncbi:MAG TPA: response regulator [Paracoccaceae bacterium]|nr:response regulator [Paracoccaceae bacterium]
MPKRVLLAEDEPNIAELLRFLLGRAGFIVDAETDGEAALAAALAGQPAVVILDVMLPGLDGLEVLRRLRADPRGRELRTIVLTAKGQRADRQAAIDGGADLFITKPFSNDELIAAVRRLADA